MAGPGGGGLRDAGAAADAAPRDRPEQEVRPCAHNCVASVAILQGSMGVRNVRQYVNLPDPGEDDRANFVDYRTNHLDRLGQPLRVRVRLQRPERATVWVRMVADASNPAYSGDETGANARYEWGHDQWRSYTTNGEGVADIEDAFTVSAAGGARFHLEALCNDGHQLLQAPGGDLVPAPGQAAAPPAHEAHLERSGTAEVWRRVWILNCRMDDPDRQLVIQVPAFAEFQRRYRRDAFIELAQLSEAPVRVGPFVVMRSRNDQEQQQEMQRLFELVNTPYEEAGGPGKQPHAMIVLWVDQIAEQAELRYVRDGVQLRRRRGHEELTIVDSDNNTQYLWWDMGGPGGEWFVRGTFVPDGRPYSDGITVTEEMLQPLEGPADAPNRRSRIRLTTGPIFEALDGGTEGSAGPTARGTVALRLRVARNWTNGFAVRGSNFICMSTRSYWKRRGRSEFLKTMLHELGHSFRQVPTDDRDQARGLDPGDHWYVRRGHTGPHCNFSVTAALVDGEYVGVHDRQARCTMYGSGGPRTAGNMLNFCDSCRATLRKIDLHPGWSTVYRTRFQRFARWIVSIIG
jgi:hypothetical protein